MLIDTSDAVVIMRYRTGMREEIHRDMPRSIHYIASNYSAFSLIRDHQGPPRGHMWLSKSQSLSLSLDGWIDRRQDYRGGTFIAEISPRVKYVSLLIPVSSIFHS